MGNRRNPHRGKPRGRKSSVEKKGKGYERVVADVAKAMDPQAVVSQGKWIMGPDGRRDMDVLITATLDRKPYRVLIECKDYDPRKTGPVGIALVDALESKRHDLGVNLALLCSNAGFTREATRKAKRVGIGLLGVMRMGDARVRILIPEEVYIRRITIKSMTIRLYSGGTPIPLGGAPFESITYNGTPIANWIIHRVQLFLTANPIVSGPYTATHRLMRTLTLVGPSGALEVDRVDYELFIAGGWYVQSTNLDASAGFYDWIRRRVRPTPAGGQFQFTNIDWFGGELIDRPPDHVLDHSLNDGETAFRFLKLSGLPAPPPEPIPDLNSAVVSEDLLLVVENLPPEAFVSSEA